MIDPDFGPVLTAFLVCIAAALSTILGGLLVFRLDASNPRVLAFGLAFAAGAMVYVSLVEILAKAQTSFAEALGPAAAYRMATIWFFVGIILVAALDRLLPKHDDGAITKDMSTSKSSVARVGLLAALAITAHNLPEGMATFFATLNDPAVGAALAVAIAIHNIPEGISIAIPIYFATQSKSKAVYGAALSALVEPLGALIGYLVLAPYLSPSLYGAVFGVIAGAMVFLSLHELMPAAKRYSSGYETAYGLVAGMALLALSLVLLR